MKHYALKSDGLLAGYDYLWRLSPDRWAWEYLRRNAAFRSDAAALSPADISERQAPCAPIRILRSRVVQTIAERWGLAVMPDPAFNALRADAVWTRSAYPDQVEVHCGARADGEACDIFERTVPFCTITHVTDSIGREFLLVRGRGCVVQVACTGISLLGMEPVRMKLTISNIDAYERRLKTQKAAMEVLGQGPDLATPVWTKRTQMLRDGLVALDCIERGLSRRQIACVLYGEKAVRAEWETTAMKDALRYVVQKAEAMRDGGYLVELLGANLGVAAGAGAF
jgi:Uncharacterized conserved protein (DUF2285)/Family of unknown function (DUF6499)